MPISRTQEEAERDIARAIAELEARGYGVQGAVSYQAPDGSVSWTICPRIPPEHDLRSPEEREADVYWRTRLLAEAPATDKDPEYVRLVAERMRLGGN